MDIFFIVLFVLFGVFSVSDFILYLLYKKRYVILFENRTVKYQRSIFKPNFKKLYKKYGVMPKKYFVSDSDEDLYYFLSNFSCVDIKAFNNPDYYLKHPDYLNKEDK